MVDDNRLLFGVIADFRFEVDAAYRSIGLHCLRGDAYDTLEMHIQLLTLYLEDLLEAAKEVHPLMEMERDFVAKVTGFSPAIRTLKQLQSRVVNAPL